jgi:hypothetical protein
MLKMTPPIVKNSIFRAAFLILFLVLFLSCATSNPYVQIDSLVEQEKFPESVNTLENRSKFIYREKDLVLYFLDKGMLAHYSGNFEESSSLLQQGELEIENNFSKSISQEIGTFILNDRTREYDGEDYEDIYLNMFNALNYYQCGNMEGALVEIRRMNNKLRNLSVKYGQIMTNMQKMALENGTEIPPNPGATVKFGNSALARYLGMIFYRGYGLFDDARIDQDQIRIAMADAPQIYKNPVPSSIKDELTIPSGKARLNVIGFAGLSPEKTEETIRIWLHNAWIKIALPVMKPRPSRITSIEVVFDTGESFSLELLEDIGIVAEATFGQKKNIIYTKSVIRASIKGIAASIFNEAAHSSSNKKGLFLLLGVTSQILAEAGEKADLRIARYFPCKAYVGGITLDPGIYSYTVVYYGQGRKPVKEFRFENIMISEKVLNLTEVVCLK